MQEIVGIKGEVFRNDEHVALGGEIVLVDI